jgi:hypothetical protein
MSLSTIRTPDIRLSLDYIENSPRGTWFLLSIPDAEPELEGRQCWLVSYKDDYTYYLERSSNRNVLTSLKQEICRYWLKNPSGLLSGDTPTKRQKDTSKLLDFGLRGPVQLDVALYRGSYRGFQGVGDP